MELVRTSVTQEDIENLGWTAEYFGLPTAEYTGWIQFSNGSSFLFFDIDSGYIKITGNPENIIVGTVKDVAQLHLLLKLKN